MEVTINARHCSIPETLRERTVRMIHTLERYHVRSTSAVVSFQNDHGGRSVEARLAVAGGPPLVARASGPTFRTALDRAVDRLERQLKRSRERIRRRRLAAGRDPRRARERVSR
jgi:ribosomal subunit interface protein